MQAWFRLDADPSRPRASRSPISNRRQGRREGSGDRRLVGQIASKQGVERNHGIPDLLQLVDRGLLVGGGRSRLPAVEVVGGG